MATILSAPDCNRMLNDFEPNGNIGSFIILLLNAEYSLNNVLEPSFLPF